MNVMKMLRRKRALERFTVMSFDRWMNEHNYTKGDDESLGMILTRNLYARYVHNKEIERKALTVV